MLALPLFAATAVKSAAAPAKSDDASLDLTSVTNTMPWQTIRACFFPEV